jgi:pimeloyl-ACP methyl ester carboxylesterase
VWKYAAARRSNCSMEHQELVDLGNADPRPLWAAAQIADLLPHGQLVVLPGVGHFPWLEKPYLLATALRRFLAEC